MSVAEKVKEDTAVEGRNGVIWRAYEKAFTRRELSP
jgi:hypothetical protein